MLTEARVHELADSLTKAGESITLARIREANGHTGSLATIARYLATWREGRWSLLETEARRDPAIDAIERLAPGTYQKVVQKAEEASRAKFDALREQLAEQDADRANLVAALSFAEERSRELSESVAAATKNCEQITSALSMVGDLAAQIKTLQESVATVSQAVSTFFVKIDDSRDFLHAELNRKCEYVQSELESQVARLSHDFNLRTTHLNEGITKIQADSARCLVESEQLTMNQFKLVHEKLSVIEVRERKRTCFNEQVIRGLLPRIHR